MEGDAAGDLARAVRVRPQPVPESFGAASSGDALDVAGGVPGGADATRALLVVVNDPDRATRTAEALLAVRARCPARPLNLLVATGSHRWDVAQRTAHAAPLLAAAGSPSRIHWHDGNERIHTSPLPGSQRQFSRYYQILAESADVLVVGSVEPHWFAGVTGAHKALSVGLTTADEIARNHRRATEPRARPFVLEGNPVFDDLRPLAQETAALGRAVALQHVDARWILGDPLATLPECADVARARWLHRVPRPLDFVVAHVLPPLSRTLYQAEKAVKHAEFAVRDGGTIVLVAGCEGGIGPSRFVQLMTEAPDSAAMQARVAKHGYQLGDHKALRLRALLDRGVRLVLVSRTFGVAAARAAGFDNVPTLAAIAPELRGEGAVVEDAAHCVLEASA